MTIDTSAVTVKIIISLPLPTPNLSRRIWQPVTDGDLAMRLAPLSWQPSGAHHALEFLARQNETMRAERDALEEELKSHIKHTDDMIRSAEPIMALALGAAENAAEAAEAKLDKALNALHFYADFYEDPSGGPWGIKSDDFGTKARKVLTELEKTE